MIKKALGILISAALALALPVIPASAQSQVESADIATSAAVISPASGEFDAVLHRSKSGQHGVLRIKFPQLGDKVQLMRFDSKGKSRQVFSFALAPEDLDTQGNYLALSSGQAVRVFSLSKGRTTFQILRNGEEYLERKTLEKTSKPLVKLNAVILRPPTQPITGNGDFSLAVRDVQEGSSIKSLCLFIDGAPASGQQISSLILNNAKLMIDNQGCTFPAEGIDQNAPVSISLNSKSLQDGKHSMMARLGLIDSADKARSADSTVSFLTDNMSLNATAPEPTFSGTVSPGQNLKALPGTWGSGVNFSYKWYSDEVMIRGAVSENYLLTHADLGKVLRVEITGTRSSQDRAVRSLETLVGSSEQQASGQSQGSIFQGAAAFNITEQASVYDSVQRKFVMKEVNNYDVAMTFPATVLCEGTGYYDTCSFKVSASWSGLFDSYESFFETVRLVRVSDRSLLDTDILFLSTFSSTDSLEFSFSAQNLRVNNSQNQFQLEIAVAGFSQVLTNKGSSSIQIIRGPNTQGSSLNFSSNDSAIKGSQSSFVFRGGSSTSPNWKLWQLSQPTRVLVMQGCAILPIFIAPQSLLDGSLQDSLTRSAADATISIFGGRGELRDKISIVGSRGDWNTLALGNRLEMKVCGLNVQKGKTENLRVQLDLRYDAYNLESFSSASMQIEMVGNMKFTKINCYQGELGQVINSYKPICLEGWTQTKAKIKNGKVEMKTLNCLAGRDLQVVRAPEAKCPEGYEVTKLAVKNEKLVPWSITCRKGFGKVVVRGVFPSCPSGYKRSY